MIIAEIDVGFYKMVYRGIFEMRSDIPRKIYRIEYRSLSCFSRDLFVRTNSKDM